VLNVMQHIRESYRSRSLPVHVTFVQDTVFGASNQVLTNVRMMRAGSARGAIHPWSGLRSRGAAAT